MKMRLEKTVPHDGRNRALDAIEKRPFGRCGPPVKGLRRRLRQTDMPMGAANIGAYCANRPNAK